MFTLKQFFAFSVLSLIGCATSAESYNVSQIWAGGNEWNMSLNMSTAPSNGSSFAIVVDAVKQQVTFNLVAGDALVGRTGPGSCIAGADILDEGRSTMDVYLAAVELAKNSALASHFRLNAFGGVCFNLDQIEYRTDLKKVKVVCDNGVTYLGQSVYVVGNNAKLGNWNPANAVKLNPVAYPQWSNDVVVPSNVFVDWKCIKRDERNVSAGIQWQSGANNQFFSGSTSVTSARF